MEINIYSYDEAFNASCDYFKGDELAARVWVNKYALKDSYGNIYEKTPDDMHHRLASELARIESKYTNPLSETDIFNLMKDFKYIVPQGSPMAGIGNNYQVGSLSNCFVIGLDGAPDSYGGIIKIDEEQVQLMKRRGGVGHDLSHVRPKGSPVKKFSSYVNGIGAVYGTLLKFHKRSCARWTSRSVDAVGFNKASRQRGIHRCENGRRQSYGCQCVGARRR